MAVSVADIFIRYPDPADFCREVSRLGGNFSLTKQDMEAFGEAYFNRYPEKYVQRNLDEVRLGYKLTRCSLLEKALAGINDQIKDLFRKAFTTPEAVSSLLEEFIRSGDRKLLATSLERLQACLDELKTTVDELPKGMIKERFLGGLSTLLNINYLLRVYFSRISSQSLQE